MKRLSLFGLLVISFLFVACGSLAKTTSSDSENMGFGIGRIDKKSNNFAVSKVETSDNDIMVYDNIYEYLLGRIPGLSVEGNKLYIRGSATMTGSPEALVLIDGVEGPLDLVNPSDVESVTVIKDASSGIYGMRGVGGVIQIETKGVK